MQQDIVVVKKIHDTKITDEEHILDVLKNIRQLLHNNGMKNLDLNFPIEFMHNYLLSKKCMKSIFYDSTKNYQGFCDCYYKKWNKVSETLKVCKEYNVERIIINIYQNNELKNELLPMSNIISVYLHELSHSVTYGISIKENSNNFIEIEHPNEFYQNYMKILQLSEKLNIFKLPNISNKYSIKNLKRFDNIDTEYISMPLYCCLKYQHLINNDNDYMYYVIFGYIRNNASPIYPLLPSDIIQLIIYFWLDTKKDENNNMPCIWNEYNSRTNSVRLNLLFNNKRSLCIIKKDDWVSNKNQINQLRGLRKIIQQKFPKYKNKHIVVKHVKHDKNSNQQYSLLRNDEDWQRLIGYCSKNDGQCVLDSNF